MKAVAAFCFVYNYIVTNANFAKKIRAITVAIISFFVYFPLKIVIRTYAMHPIPIPLEME